MNWPAVTQTLDSSIKSVKVEYLTRTTELIIDVAKCTACAQCVKVCPHEALERPVIKREKGVKVSKEQRIPIMPDPTKCVFCGTCMIMCPYDAISMKLDSEPLKKEDLKIIQQKVLPPITSVKVGKVETSEPDFAGDFWDELIDKITIKRNTGN